MPNQEVQPRSSYVEKHKRLKTGTAVRVWRASPPFYGKGATGVVVEIPFTLRLRLGKAADSMIYLVQFMQGEFDSKTGVEKLGQFLVAFDVISAINLEDIEALPA